MDTSLLESKNLADLREIAKLAGVKSPTKYKKAELLSKLLEMDDGEEESSISEMDMPLFTSPLQPNVVTKTKPEAASTPPQTAASTPPQTAAS
ncbi:MAG: Rho termination factor N-terminal domain-containing protein, partial [Christensenella sp.]